jgi:hypothetical protein
VKGLRDEAASWRTKLRDKEKEVTDLGKRVKELEDADLSDQERATKQLEEAQTELATLRATDGERQTTVRDALLEADVVKACVTAETKIQDPDAAYKLLDRSQIEYDETSGRATNLPALLEALATEKPWLVATEGGVTIPPVEPTNPTKPQAGKVPTRAEISRMTPEEINELWENGTLPEALRKGAIH